MSDAAINPNFTQEELDKEKAKLIENVKSGESSAASVASRVRNVLAYGKITPMVNILQNKLLTMFP